MTLERVTSASIVPQAVIEQEAAGNLEMRDLQLRQNFGGEKDMESYTFRWQEKVYSDVSLKFRTQDFSLNLLQNSH